MIDLFMSSSATYWAFLCC